MLKAIVIDDEIKIREYIVNTIEKNSDITIIGSCGSVKEGLILLKYCNPDVVFLDIQLSDGTAFDILSELESIDFRLVFITSYEQYALKAIKCGAFDYILKPLDIDEIKETVEKLYKDFDVLNDNNMQRVKLIEDQLSGTHDSITLRFKDGMRIVMFSEIVYCFSESGYTTFYLNDDSKVMVSKGLKEYEKLLPTTIFFRTHKSYLVNKSYIQEYYNNGTLKLRDSDTVPVAFRRKDEVLKYFK
jgi:two-component system LytT family response regulator